MSYFNRKNDLRLRLFSAAVRLNAYQSILYLEAARAYAREHGTGPALQALLDLPLDPAPWYTAMQAADLAAWAAWQSGWDKAGARRWGKDGQRDLARETCLAALVWLAERIEGLAAERPAAE